MARVSRAQALSAVLRAPDWWRTALRQGRPLAWPQVETRDTLLRALADNHRTHAGGTWVVMSARQTMKNEVEAELEALALYSFSRAGGVYVRTAPSYDQIVTSRQRLLDVLNTCPVCAAYGRARQIEGNFTVLPWGRAKIRFISSDPTARVVGATASLALSSDEHHEVAPEHWASAIEPFTGSTNAPVFCWGVAADGGDLLQQERERNAERWPERNLIYPADTWAEIWPDTYGRTWEARLARYGRDNPAVRMNYLLEPVAAVASFLGSYTESLLNGDHDRMAAPPRGLDTVMLVDVAGEEDIGSDEAVEALRSGASQLDSTAVIIAGVQPEGELPRCRLLDLRIWEGKPWEEQQAELAALIELWDPVSVVVDRAGIGQMLATGLRKRFGSRVLAYHADSSSVDADLTELYGLLYNGKVRLFRNDMSADYTEAVRQLKAARRIVRGGKLKVAKERSTDRIDFAKALTYLPRALNRRLSPDTATGGEQRAHAATQPRSRDLLSGW